MPLEEPQREAGKSGQEYGASPDVSEPSRLMAMARRWLSPLFLSSVLVAPFAVPPPVGAQEKEKSSLVKEDREAARVRELVAIYRDPKTSPQLRRSVDAFLYDASGKLIQDIRTAWPKLKVDERTRDIFDQPETDAFEAQCKAIGAPALRRLIDEPIESQEYTGMYDFWNNVARKMTAADPSLDPVLISLLGRPERDEGDSAPYRLREALRSAGPRVIPALSKVIEGTYWSAQEWKLSPDLEASFKSYVARLPRGEQETKGKVMRRKLNEVPWAMGLPSQKDSYGIAVASAKHARKDKKVRSPQGESAEEIARFLLAQPTASQTEETVEIFLRSLTYHWKSREFTQALLGMESVGGEKGVMALRTLTLRKDLPFDVRMPCAKVLVRLDMKGKTQEELQGLLLSTDTWERYVAISAFLHQAQHVRDVSQNAGFNSKEAQQEALSSYRILAPKLLAALATARRDPDPEIRGKAVQAYGALFFTERGQWEEKRGKFTRTPEILTSLLSSLRDDPVLDVRRAAADALVMHPYGGDPLLMDPLFSRVRDSKEDPGIRATALEYLTGRNSLFLLAKGGKFDAFRSTCIAIVREQKGERASYLEHSAAAALGSMLTFSYDPTAGSDIYGELSVDQKKDFLEKREKILQECIAFYRRPFRDALVQDLAFQGPVIRELLCSCPGRPEESAVRLIEMLRGAWETRIRGGEEEQETVQVLSGLLTERGKECKEVSREGRPAVREAATAFLVDLCDGHVRLLLLPLAVNDLEKQRKTLTVYLQTLPLPVRREMIRELRLDEGIDAYDGEGEYLWRISATEAGEVRVTETDSRGTSSDSRSGRAM